MNVFVYTTILVFVLFYIGHKPVKSPAVGEEKAIVRDTYMVAFILGTALLAFVSGQRFAFGDTMAYINHFNNAMPIDQCLSSFAIGNEWLFQLYMSFIHTYITTDPRVYIEITAYLTIFPLLYFLYNYSGDLRFAFYLFVVSGCWEHSMNGLRQYLAAAILAACFPLLVKKRWYLYLPIVFVAAQMHTSAYIFIPLYFIANTKAFGKITWTIIIIGMLVVVTSPFTGNFVSSLLSETDYGTRYGSSTWQYSINIFRVMVAIVPVVLAYVNRRRMRNKYKYYDVVFNMSLFFAVFTAAGIFSAVYARFNLYFEIYTVVLLVWNINEMTKYENYKWIKPAACICYALFFLYQMLGTYHLNWHEDHLFFVDDWSKTSWL